jgi:hypothetical protein
MTAAKWMAAAGMAAWFAAVWSSPVFADCQDDLMKFAQQRQTLVEAINGNAKANKGKLDPITACPKLRSLADVEKKMAAYMEKNKDWCSLPEDQVTGISKSSTQTAMVASKACAIATQMKQQQQNPAMTAVPATKLPTGPL